jgi:predicted HTH domain antitoxin
MPARFAPNAVTLLDTDAQGRIARMERATAGPSPSGGLAHSGLLPYTYPMQMTLNVPEAANLSETDAQLLFAIKLFEAEKLSLGKAAEVAGLSYRTFYELLVRYNVPVVSYSVEDIKMDVENARRYINAEVRKEQV